MIMPLPSGRSSRCVHHFAHFQHGRFQPAEDRLSDQIVADVQFG
jgi:hypothetical protein